MKNSNRKERSMAIAKAVGLVISCCGLISFMTYKMVISEDIAQGLNQNEVATLKRQIDEAQNQKLSLINYLKETDLLNQKTDSIEQILETLGNQNSSHQISLNSEIQKLQSNQESLSRANINEEVLPLTEILIGHLKMNREAKRLYFNEKAQIKNEKNQTQSALDLCTNSQRSGNSCAEEKAQIRQMITRVQNVANTIMATDFCNGPGNGNDDTKRSLQASIQRAVQ